MLLAGSVSAARPPTRPRAVVCDTSDPSNFEDQHARYTPGLGGGPILFGGGVLSDTYPDVFRCILQGCMYPACILKDTCIPYVS